MKKIKLPASNKFPEQNRWLSMDDYVEFINFNSRYFRKNKSSKEDDIAMRVNVPFTIK
jgi:hypothetical protein